MKEYSVILFESNNYAMWCNDTLKSNKIGAKLINVPRHLSSDCGYCVRIERSDAERTRSLMESEGIEFESIEEI